MRPCKYPCAKARLKAPRIAAYLAAAIAAWSPAWAAEGSKCATSPLHLWGDGVHDDTDALNAWFRGDKVAWAQTGRPVGPEIGGPESGGRVFRLSGPVYIPSGTGRSIERFQLVWPERKERVAGGAIVAGLDPAKPPVATNLTKVGARPDEGVPFKTPDPKPRRDDAGTDCLVS
jgi:hypothetical protein